MPDQPDHSGQRLQQRQDDLERERQAMRCVARLIVRGQETGSGFLLPGSWLLTCQHVLPSAQDAADRNSTAEFDHGLDGEGRPARTTAFHFDPASYHCSPFRAGDDWALVRLQPHPQRGLASVLYHGLPLVELAPQAGMPVTVVQHPLGSLKKTAQGRLVGVGERLQHDVSTAGGSSGSPLFDAQWQVIGLHQGVLEEDEKQAIPIDRVIAGIRAAGCWPLAPQGPDCVDDRTAMDPESPWYVDREADRQILAKHRQQSVTLYLKGPAQLGKSSLVRRLQRQLKKDGWNCVELDLRSDFDEGKDFESAPLFFRRVADTVLTEIGGPAAALNVFNIDGTAGVYSAFLAALRHGPQQPRLALTLDRLEQLAGKPCCAAVLSGLLKAHQAPRSKPWLRQILVSTLKPRGGIHGSVLDVAAARIDLADFTLAEMTELVARHGSLRIDAEALHQFLGGHPALTRQALNHLADPGTSVARLVLEAHSHGGIFRPHLDTMVARFREHPESIELADAFRRLALSQPPSCETQFEALLALGVASGTDCASARPRCQLYCAWLPNHLPPR